MADLPNGRQARINKIMIWYTYILKCSNGSYYKGFTGNLNRRLQVHLSGRVRFTKVHLPIKLVHVEVCNTKVEARLLELFFKKGSGREII